MSRPDRFAAEILEASASAYAGLATAALFGRVPGMEQRFGPGVQQAWHGHLTRRVLELAAAVRVGEPRLFVSRVEATDFEFRARELGEHDVAASLDALREVLEEELPEDARDVVLSTLDEGRAALEEPAEEAPLDDPSTAPHPLASRYLLTVLEGDARGALDGIAKALDEGLDPRAAYLDVLLAAQDEVGRMWHAGEVTVAEEHFVSDTTERAMALVAHRAERAPPNGKTVLAAAVAGNVHAIGMRAVADLFELEGWRVVSLGADVPVDDVAAAATFFDVDLVALSAALAIQLKVVEETVAVLRRAAAVKIMVGGSAFAESPDLWRRLGADGYAESATDAVALGAELTGVAGPGRGR